MTVAPDTGVDLLPVLAVSCLGLIFSVLVIFLCVCGEKSKDKQAGEENTQLTKETESHVNSVALNIDESVTVIQNPSKNGDLRNSGGSPKGGSSPLPHGANHRELPQPPTSTRNTIAGTTIPFRIDQTGKRNTIGETVIKVSEEQDDYDHLSSSGITRNNQRRSNYDHVTIGEDGNFTVQSRKPDVVPDEAPEDAPENDYAEVERENIYEGVKEKENYVKEENVNQRPSNTTKKIFDPYSSVNDDEEEETVKKVYDPYSHVKDEDSNSGSFSKKSNETTGAVESSKKIYDPYSHVKDSDSNSGSFAVPYDPYSKVRDDKDESSGGTFKDVDPYSTVKDGRNSKRKNKDDPYSKVKEAETDSAMEFDPYSAVKEDVDDPYNKVVDDPYNKVKGDENGDDPPYNKVKDDDPDDPYNSVDEDEEETPSTTKKKTPYQYSTVNKVTSDGDDSNFSVQNSIGEYAQVMKNKNSEVNVNRPLPAPTESLNRRSDVDPYALPPEPPRRYHDDHTEPLRQSDSERSEVAQSVNVSQSTNSTVVNPADSNVTGEGATALAPSTAVEPVKHKEPPYHKLTARESMASINARRALNTYEEVPDKENMYATVEGGSGDGVVSPKSGAENSPRPIRQELYAEIDNGTEPPVPAPPSLDSLHLMTEGRSRLSADMDSSNRSSYAESQKSPVASSNPRSSCGSTDLPGVINAAFEDGSEVNTVTLDPNYTTVRDCIPDSEGEMDPNYESVEEVKSKVHYHVMPEEQREAMMARKKRLHVYEEVKETNEVKDRVLKGHMYEDLDGVKQKKEELDKNKDDSERRNSDIWKKRSDVDGERL